MIKEKYNFLIFGIFFGIFFYLIFLQYAFLFTKLNNIYYSIFLISILYFIFSFFILLIRKNKKNEN